MTLLQADTQAWLFLCEAAQVDEGAGLRIELPGRAALAVFNVEGRFFVTDDTCTHGKASLCDGFIEDGHVECPWHGARFCIETGEAKTFPAVVALRTYRTRTRNGRVEIAAV